MEKLRFLVPTDFSDNAQNAIRYAGALAQVTNASIMLTHIVPPFLDDSSFLTVDTRVIKAEAAGSLKVWQEVLQNEFGIACRSIVGVGDVTEQIVTIAEIHEADMIIMGTQGARGINKLFFGSNASSVIAQSAIPVLAVPDSVSFTKLNKIVYATDYNESEIEVLEHISNFASHFRAEIIAVHVVDEYERQATALSITDYFSDMIKRKISYPLTSCRLFRHEDIAEGIELFMSSVGADILAISRREHTLFEKVFNKSLTNQFVWKNKIPLLVFHMPSRD